MRVRTARAPGGAGRLLTLRKRILANEMVDGGLHRFTSIFCVSWAAGRAS